MSPPSETASLAGEYTPAERSLLLNLAHQAIASALDRYRLDTTPPTEHLAEKRGAFTTLHLNGKLRGCIGYVIAEHSLYRTVAETARAAALDDPRFPPVTAEEAPHLRIEISVLSPVRPMRPDEVVIGRHGLLIAKGTHRGLLLPQVPVEWGWDRETFLAQLCRKAGLPTDAWMQDADLKGFTAEIFGEEDCTDPIVENPR